MKEELTKILIEFVEFPCLKQLVMERYLNNDFLGKDELYEEAVECLIERMKLGVLEDD